MVSNILNLILTMDSSVGWFNNVTHKTGEIDGDSPNSSKFVKMGSKNGGMVLDDPYVVGPVVPPKMVVSQWPQSHSEMMR